MLRDLTYKYFTNNEFVQHHILHNLFTQRREDFGVDKAGLEIESIPSGTLSTNQGMPHCLKFSLFWKEPTMSLIYYTFFIRNWFIKN